MTKTSKKAPTAASEKTAPSGIDAITAKLVAASKTRTIATTAASKPSPSKLQQLALLLLRDEGATLAEMIAATGWLPHTTRAALTGLKKKGYAISSDKLDGVRTYRGIAPE